MESLDDIAADAIAQIPPACRVTAAHTQAIQRHSAALVSIGPDLVTAFHDIVFGHPETARIFAADERPHQEEILGRWWQRTVAEPLDGSYWSWMALAGLVHVARHVGNPMMLSMTEFVAAFVAERIGDLVDDPAERELLIDAIRRVTTTVGVITTHASEEAVRSALFEVAGMPEALLERLRDQEVNAAVTALRGRGVERP